MTDSMPCAGIGGVSSFHIAVYGTSLLILPTLFLESFKRLSWLNLMGFISTMVVTATIIVLVAVDPFRDHMPAQVWLLLTSALLLVSAGVFLIIIHLHMSCCTAASQCCMFSAFIAWSHCDCTFVCCSLN